MLRANSGIVEEQLIEQTTTTVKVPKTVEEVLNMDRRFVKFVDELLVMDLKCKEIVMNELERRSGYNKIWLASTNLEKMADELQPRPLATWLKSFLHRLRAVPLRFEGVMALVSLAVRAGECDLPDIGTFSKSLARATFTTH